MALVLIAQSTDTFQTVRRQETAVRQQPNLLRQYQVNFGQINNTYRMIFTALSGVFSTRLEVGRTEDFGTAGHRVRRWLF
jgi:hypothetical protein